jgi:hypothetical protein
MLRYWFDVIRPDATSVAAEMIRNESIRNRPDKYLICNTMGVLESPLKPHLAVAIRVASRQPLPTLILNTNLRLDPLR